jgi:hypothetical protein
MYFNVQVQYIQCISMPGDNISMFFNDSSIGAIFALGIYHLLAYSTVATVAIIQCQHNAGQCCGATYSNIDP